MFPVFKWLLFRSPLTQGSLSMLWSFFLSCHWSFISYLFIRKKEKWGKTCFYLWKLVFFSVNKPLNQCLGASPKTFLDSFFFFRFLFYILHEKCKKTFWPTSEVRSTQTLEIYTSRPLLQQVCLFFGHQRLDSPKLKLCYLSLLIVDWHFSDYIIY